MRASEIRVKRIRVNQGLGVLSTIDFFNKLVSNFVMNLSNRVHLAP